MVNRMNKPETARSEQYIDNLSFDEELGLSAVETVVFDGVGLKREISKNLQTKVVTSGGYVYVCRARVGTALATAKWLVYRIDQSTGSKMFADGNDDFDNVATDPTVLTYSYT